MPPPETFHRHQTAVLWEKVGDNAQGEPIINAPIELTPDDGTGVRWEAGVVNPQDDKQEPVRVDAVVVVIRDIPIGSQMWLGTLDEWYGTGSSGQDTEVMWVIRQINVPDLKRRKYRKEVWLQKAQATPGTLTT